LSEAIRWGFADAAPAAAIKAAAAIASIKLWIWCFRMTN
jgi:hypothetical protein